MANTGAEIVASVLETESIQWVFGIPGTHNIELYDAISNRKSIQSVLVTHELSAAFMADGVARATGNLAALNLVPGAGLTHALSGIAESYLDQVPMLVLLSAVRSDTGASYQLHDIDQISMATPVAKRVFQPKSVTELRNSLHEACALARLAPHGPAVVVIPANLFLERELKNLRNAPHFEITPHDSELNTNIALIARTLNTSSSIAIYAGLGAQSCAELLPEFAEILDAIVYTTISGKGLFPETHVRWVWNTMGRSAPVPIREIEREIDCVLAIGCRFSEVATGSYGFSTPKNLIHVDIDPQVFSKNYKASHQLVADAKTFVQEILSSGLLKARSTNFLRLDNLAQAHMKVLNAQRNFDDENYISPATLFHGLQEVFGDNAVFVTDSGRGTLLAMENLRIEKPRSYLSPVDYSAMGYSIPAAIGAKLAASHRPVVALTGDGAFLMTGLELLTASELGIGIIVCLLRDGELAQISKFQSAALGRKLCTTLPRYQTEQMAAAVGAHYLKIRRGSESHEVFRQAKVISEQGRPVLIEVCIDPEAETFFSKGVIQSNFLRFSWPDRLRLASRKAIRSLRNPLLRSPFQVSKAKE